ncbi:MAG: hypothetical protein QXI49_02580 [Candidatus Methanomethylicaceae archaeon]
MSAALIILPLIGILITIISGAIAMLFPNIAISFLGAINAPQNIYSLLIEIPRPFWDNNTYFFPAIENNIISGYSGLIGISMTNFYAMARIIAFILLSFSIIIASFSYFLQNFKIINEGIAIRILTGSIMCIIFIYIFPIIYDSIAIIVNTITYPSPYSILKPGMIDEILLHSSIILPTENNDIGSALAGLFINLLLFIFTLITYISLTIMGILRTFFIGAAFALMPILLVLRLLPFIDRIADIFIQVLIGGILTSIIVSIFFAFGYDLITSSKITGLMKTLISLGILLSSSLMITFLIPTLGSIMSTVTNVIIGATTGAAIGGVAITTGAVIGAYQAGQVLSPLIKAGVISTESAILRSTLSALGGATGTLGTMASRIIPGITNFGLPTAISMGRKAASLATLNLPEIEESEIAEALVLKAAATPHDAEDNIMEIEKWCEKVKTMLLNRPPEVIGYEIANMTRIKIKNYELLGRKFQEKINELINLTDDNPNTQKILLSRIGRLYNTWKEMSINSLISDPDDKNKKISLSEYVDKLAKKTLENNNLENNKEELERMKQKIFEIILEKKQLNGFSPITLYSAIKEKKINANKISEFILKDYLKQKMNNQNNNS